jgi:hypothetical protein
LKKQQELERLKELEKTYSSKINVGTVRNDRQLEAVIHVYDGDAVPHLLALLQDIDNTYISLSTVKDIVEILGEDREQFEMLLIKLF